MSSADWKALGRLGQRNYRLSMVKQVRSGQLTKAQAALKLKKRYGLRRQLIYEWLAKFEAKGKEGLHERPRRGRPAALKPGEAMAIKRLVRYSSPKKLGLGEGTWTPQTLLRALEQELRCVVSVRTAGRLLADVRGKKRR